MSITARQKKIAELIGSGLTQEDAAHLLGVNRATVVRDLADPECRALADRLEQDGVTLDPAEAVLRSLLLAVRPDGSPDNVARIAAAKALRESNPSTEPSMPREVVHVVYSGICPECRAGAPPVPGTEQP